EWFFAPGRTRESVRPPPRSNDTRQRPVSLQKPPSFVFGSTCSFVPAEELSRCVTRVRLISPTQRLSPRILKAEGLGLVIVSKGFRKASPGHDGAQCLLRCVSRHVVFELVEEPPSWRSVTFAFLQHTPDMGGKWNTGQQLSLEELFTVVQRCAR